MSGPQPKTKAQEVSEILAKHMHKKHLSEFIYTRCKKLLLSENGGNIDVNNAVLLCFVELYGGDVKKAYGLACELLSKSQNIGILRNIHPILVDLGDFKSASVVVEKILDFSQKTNSDFLSILPYRVELVLLLSGRIRNPIFHTDYSLRVVPQILTMVDIMELLDLNEKNLLVISDIINKTLLRFNQRIYKMKYSTIDEELLVLFYLDAEFKELQEINAEIFKESYKVGVHADLEKISCYCVPYEGNADE